MTIPSVDYQTLIEELRHRFCCPVHGSADESQGVMDTIRGRMACLLETSPDASMQEIIDQLAAKWQQDGLI